MSIGEDTNGFSWCLYCSTLLLATLTGSGDSRVSGLATGLLLRAVLDSMAAGVAAAAHMRVAAVSGPAPGGLFEVRAHCLGATLFSVGVS